MNAIGSNWSLDDRMTVVLFAGMGGGCDGLEDAGFHVHLAVNHDPLAIAVHESRHPHTKHLRCDVFEVDPRAATQGRGVRVLHVSPDCTHFSVAKGAKPVSKRRRSLAWVVPRWCGTVRPEVVTLENVREITTWGPLIAKRDKATGRVLRLDGSVAEKGERVPVEQQWLIPDPRHKGRIWRAWLKHMRGLGYSFEHRSLCCADFGVPTIRTRLFGVAHDARDPLHTVTVNDRHGLVTVEVNGQTMVITDISMRMLDPLEGARAHGFDPASLQHDIEVTDAKGRKVRRKPNKTEIGHLVGNSVPPRMVELLARANCRHELTVAA